MVFSEIEVSRINARKTDVFDIFNSRFYEGPNPYLETAAFAFDFALTSYSDPLPIENYLTVISERYPHLADDRYDSHAQLFARTVSEVNRLDMDLHFHHWSVQPVVQLDNKKFDSIAIESLHARTCRSVVYSVWDWFEAITRGKSFQIDDDIEVAQGLFRRSVYGGPTTYALLRTAYEKNIPTFYLWDEGLMQYGYGKRLVRGAATTFDCDSHLDSDFTTRKDDCKAFLDTLGFPVPTGSVVRSFEEALSAAAQIGYPVAVKPVVGHKGIGVTANVQDVAELEAAYRRAVRAIPDDQPIDVIVETSITGKDFRLLCVNGRFVAATERRPAFITGDGDATIAELIARENRSPSRSDTPTSPLGKIKIDDAMERYLEQQGFTLDTVPNPDQIIYLRKVANLSSGGFSIDATETLHPDNVILAQDIAQHFRLTCLGIDLVAEDVSRSWKDGNFGIIEINSAPGISMHLRPAIGNPVDVTSAILDTFFETNDSARIPILTFNHISVSDLQELVDHILQQHPDWVIGAVCQEGVFINRSKKVLHRNYNTNVSNLLRNPKLDLLVAEYPEAILEQQGMFYYGSNLVVLDNPTATETMLARDVFPQSVVVTRQHKDVSIRRAGLIEQYQLGEEEPFTRVFLKEVSSIL
ncbi:acetate--CoA ligase family protein [Thermocoleostomius sinensis]|uniref:Acetate--CoA ligase family protein n=1 Tax=Thermocoleostomius sinensis A174 TaxID=2016057 RepID=A0A9E8ZF94_9CYAN|nr:acetate--CoA ligase family protein [Thermocoleostomius sinensis]WAL62289.1 acetate--CoA ligase family protein [Thermocoleostomius sinensis A174]